LGRSSQETAFAWRDGHSEIALGHFQAWQSVFIIALWCEKDGMAANGRH
jgi:hypothetical protein